MININIEELTGKDNVNKYSLVTAVAKRARVIAEQMKIDTDKGVAYEKRPVSKSFDELVEGKYAILARDPGKQDED